MTQIPLQSRFKQDFYRVRYPVGAYVNGRYTVSSPTVAAYKGSIQPAVDRGSEVMTSMREGQRTKKIIIVYTYPDTLRTADERTGTKADLVYFNNELFEVQKVNRWTGQILTHDEVWAVESDASTPNLYQARVELDDNNEVVNAVSSQSITGNGESVDSNQDVDVIGSSSLVANGTLDDSNQDVDGTGDATSSIVGLWSLVGGSNVSYTAPSITALNSTDIVFADRDNDALRLYRWGGASWSLVGTALSVAMTHPGIIALNSTDFAWIDSSANELRTYRWNGSAFAQVGSSLTGLSLLAGPQGLARLSDTRVAHVNGNGDTLRAYDWNGSTWSQVGSGFGVGSAGNVSITALNGTDIVFVDGTGDELRLYRFNGSTWAQVGNTFLIPNLSAPAIQSINGTDIALFDNGIDRLRTYRFDGTDFAQLGSEFTISSASGRPWLTYMGSNTIAFVDDNLDVIRLYLWS